MVFVTHSYPRFSGDAAGSFLLTLAQALATHDINVEVVAPGAAGLAAYEVLDGIPVHRFRYAPRSWETLAYTGTMAETVARTLTGKVALAGYLWAQGGALKRLVRRLDAALVHAHWWFPAGLVASASRRRQGRPLLVTMHGSDVRLAAGRTWAHGMFRRVLRSAAAVTVVSSWLAAQTRRMAPGMDPIVAPMPVNTSLFSPAARGQRARDELLYVGRLNEQKGLRLLLSAVAAMRQPARISVVGDGPDAIALREHAASLGIAGRVAWHGHLPRESLVALYQRATAVVIPSLDEGLGLVAVEAQLCETPVVAFASGGLVDIITHDETGLLVPAGDVSAFATALDRLLGDLQLQLALGSTGRARALATFSPAAVAARYAGLYRQLVAHGTH